MFDKNVSRPKTTNNPTTAYLNPIVAATADTTYTLTKTTPHTRSTTIITTRTTTTNMWVIVQLCLIILINIQILASVIAPVNCDKLIPTLSSFSTLLSPSQSSPPPPSSLSLPANTIVRHTHNGDKLLLSHRRITRLTHLENDSLITAANNTSSVSSGESGPAAIYMASFGLRTRFQPQKFYSQKERSSAGKNGGNFVSLNLITEPPKDICEGFCQCERKKNAFVTVTCDYQTNSRVSEFSNL